MQPRVFSVPCLIAWPNARLIDQQLFEQIMLSIRQLDASSYGREPTFVVK